MTGIAQPRLRAGRSNDISYAVVGIVEDEPVDAMYLNDAVVSVAPAAQIVVFGELDKALHALAALQAAESSRTKNTRKLLFIDAGLLEGASSAAAESLRRQRSIGDLYVVALLTTSDFAAVQRTLSSGADAAVRRPVIPELIAQLLGSEPALAKSAAA